jgi:lipoprotein-releasing system permease protein
MLRGTERGTFSPMTIFAWLAIGVGVGTMCSLLSVMYGLESSLRDSVLKAYPHIMVHPRAGSSPIRGYDAWTERLRKIDGVRRVMPYVETEMIVQSDERAIGAVVWGTPMSDLAKLKGDLTQGGIPRIDSKLPQAILGQELAHHLDVEVGNQIQIISPIKRGGAMGLVPQSQLFEVAGIYESGHYDFDKQHLFLLLEDAQDLMGTGKAITGWHVWCDSLGDTDRVQKRIAAILPGDWVAQSWTSFNSALFQSLKLEQYAMFLVLSFAIVIAVMNIAITLMMHVTHKKRNIGVLRALGASAQQIRQIFVWQGAFLGMVGLVLGAVLSVVMITYVQNSYEFPDIYYVRSVPVEIRPLSLTLVFVVATALIFLATLYPSLRASQLDPIEAIRE